MTIIRVLAVSAVLNVFSLSASAFELGSPFPRHALPGDLIEIGHIGGDSSGVFTASVGGVAAVVESGDATTIVVRVPAGPVDGTITITQDGVTKEAGSELEIDRVITGQVILPPAVSQAGYLVGTTREAIYVPGNGTFSVRMPRDRASLIWAARNENDPAFATLVLPSQSSVVIDSQSTAKSLLFLLPGFFSIDPVEAETRWDLLGNLPGLADFSEVIRVYSADGTSYLEDVRGRATVDAVYTSALSLGGSLSGSAASGSAASPPPAGSHFKPGQPPGTALRDLNIDFEGRIPVTLFRINSSLQVDPEVSGRVVLDLGNYSDRTNPADWLVRFFELPTAQFGSFEEINGVGLKDLIVGPSDEPLGIGIVRANLKSKNGDLIEVIGEAVANQFTSTLPNSTLSHNQIAIDATKAGVYYSEAVSGNLWYGTSPFFPFILGGGEAVERSQEALLTGSGANGQYYSALSANLIIASFNALAAAGVDPFDFIKQSELRVFLKNFTYEFTKTVATYLASVPESGSAMLSFKTGRELSVLAFTAVHKAVVELTTADTGLLSLTRVLAKGIVKTLANQINVVGRISDGLQTLERLAGVLAPTALAMERSIVVIGNPFDARVTSFWPKFGKTGDFINLHGHGFGSVNSDLAVSFCAFNGSQDPNDPLAIFQPSVSIPAEILEVTDRMVTIRVPDGMEGQFLGNDAAICVERTGTDQTTTLANELQYRFFKYIPKPAVTGVVPVIVRSGEAVIEIRGTNFDPIDGKMFGVSITGPGSPSAEVQGITQNAVSVQVNTSDEGAYQLELRRIDQVVGTVNFTVTDPRFAGLAPGQGAIIGVDSPSLANVPDNVFTLGEAMLFAAGQLGRAPTSDGDLTDGNPKEEDAFSIGGNVRRIVYSGPSPVVLPSTLPPLASGWIYELPTFDGSNLGPNAIGFDVSVDGVTLNARVQNFGSHGLRLSGGVKNCRFPVVEVANVGGHGVFLDGGASDNQFFDTMVTQPEGHGLYLSGAGVVRNNFRCTLDGVTVNLAVPLSQFDQSASGYGVLIEGGASVNSVSFDKIRGNQLGGVRITGTGTRGNVIGWASKVKPILREISNNGGHGVLIDTDASHTICRWLHLNDNQGDGIRIDGTSYNHVQGIYTGYVEVIADGGFGLGRYHLAAPPEDRNTGAGIRLMNGASFNVIGSRNNGTFFERGGIANNADSGIILEGAGTRFNRIGKHNIGDLETMGSGKIYSTLAEALSFSGSPPDLSNGLHGVEVRDGASDNEIGSENSTLDLHISGASNGAGIMVDSSVTPCLNNTIVGNQIGTETGIFEQPGLPRVGVYLKGPCRGTVIGYPGVKTSAEITLAPGDFVNNRFYTFRSYNVIGNCTEAGIRMEDVAVPFVNGEPDNPNVVQGNFIGINDGTEFIPDFGIVPNRVGVHVVGNSSGNLIGGGVEGEGNDIAFNAEYGVLFESVQQPDEERRTFWRGNKIHDGAGGDTFTFVNPMFPRVPAPAGNVDPLQGPVSGIGVLFRDGAPTTGVFGESISVANEIRDNVIGVYFDETEGGTLRGCLIEGNEFAGVFMAGAIRSRLGGGGSDANVIINNGDGVATFGGGVVMDACLFVEISGNRIGVTQEGQDGGNLGDGIVIKDCEDVIIGGSIPGQGNVIGFNDQNGVLITGTGSSGIRLEHNTIGGDDAGRIYPNGNSGVRVDGGVGHVIGGIRQVAIGGVVQPVIGRNVITRNQDDGVLVDGSGVRASILYNSIFSNAGDGIALTQSGNDDQVAPLITSIVGNRVTGTVPSLAEIPAGSIVQLFADRAPMNEGEVLMGTTEVKPGGSWSLVMNGPFPFSPTLTMTATNVSKGVTSMFGVDTTIEVGMRVRRTDGLTPATKSIEFGPNALTALAFSVDAIHADAGLDSFTFRAAGSLDDAAAISGVMIYRDADEDGQIGPGDPLLSAPVTFDANNGEAKVVLDGYRVESGTSANFLLVCEANGLVGGGQDFGVVLETVNSVKAFFYTPPSAVATPGTADFPVTSDTFQFQTSALNVFLTSFFGAAVSDPLVGGPFANTDGDRFSNLAEFLLGLNPTIADDHKVQFVPTKSAGQLTLEFTRPVGAAATTFVVESSRGLRFWNDATLSESLISTTSIDNGDGTETLQVVLTVPADQAGFYRMQFGL